MAWDHVIPLVSASQDSPWAGVLGGGVAESSSFLTVQETQPRGLLKTSHIHRGSQLGPGQGQRLPSQEALDHPDISYVNHPLKLKWRYLFRIMVYTYSGTYLCVDFKHHIYGRIFFFNLHLLNRKLSGIYFYFRSVFPLKIAHTFFLKSILWQHLKNTQYLVMTFIR